VLIHSDRRWGFDVGAGTLWDAIAVVEDYRRWWPWLRGFEANGLVAGDTWRCVVQPPLPYTLRFRVSIDEVEPRRLVSATVAGDVTGTARLEIDERDDGCEARLVSALSPGNGALRVVTRFAAPIVRFGHDWVLDAGAHQFVDRAVGGSRRPTAKRPSGRRRPR
jgi:uncharacterized protein YndB with AHSA1/START domain